MLKNCEGFFGTFWLVCNLFTFSRLWAFIVESISEQRTRNMVRQKYLDSICLFAVALALVVSLLVLGGTPITGSAR